MKSLFSLRPLRSGGINLRCIKMEILKSLLIVSMILAFHHVAKAQYDFEIIQQVDNTEVKSQDKTGTCWSFASISFLESEVLRTKGQAIDLSEMYIVRDVYLDKARNYILRQGNANFSEGSLAHDMLNAGIRNGLVPESAYSGKLAKKHNHELLFDELKTYLDSIIDARDIPTNWQDDFNGILDEHMNDYEDSFSLDEKNFNAESYTNYLGLELEAYTHVTSFTHHPFDESFILEIPDNYSNGSYLNVDIDRLQAMVDMAIEKGHSVIWDGDVSEKGFSAKRGLAINPVEFKESCFDKPCKEKIVTQKDRQQAFESYVTTDDHLMHLVGTAKDENGANYYIIKNSWGEISDYKGYLMMSESYFRAKTVGISINKVFVNQSE